MCKISAYWFLLTLYVVYSYLCVSINNNSCLQINWGNTNILYFEIDKKSVFTFTRVSTTYIRFYLLDTSAFEFDDTFVLQESFQIHWMFLAVWLLWIIIFFATCITFLCRKRSILLAEFVYSAKRYWVIMIFNKWNDWLAWNLQLIFCCCAKWKWVNFLQFNTKVDCVEPIENGGCTEWRLSYSPVSSDNVPKTSTFHALMICSGYCIY